jgi:putative ABC transport system permease protein
VNVLESSRIAVIALRANPGRSALTTLGVIIGVAAVILLVSIGEGARAYIEKEMTGMGTNLLVIQPGKSSTAGGFHPPAAGSVHKLTFEDAKAVKRRAYAVSDAVPITLGTGKVKVSNLSRDTMIIGTTPEFPRVRNLFVEIGDFVTEADVDTKSKVVVLGRTVYRELFGDRPALGARVTIADAKFRVVGIMQTKGMTLGFDIDDIVFIPVTAAMELYDTDALHEILAAAGRAEEVDLAIRQIKDVLIKRHAGKEDFTIITQRAMMSTMDTILTVLTGVLGGIAGISLVVGGIGIMNIMLVSVKERTREIGIRKAVGARRIDILQQFLFEAVILSLIGGVIGIIVGGGIAYSIPLFYSAIPTRVSLWSVTLAFFFSVAVGVFFGVEPARRAARLDPIEALRYE